MAISTLPRGSILASKFPLELRLTNEDDTYTGTSANNTVYGLDGNDTIDGAGGDDTLYGDAGDDTLRGGDGNDYLSGRGDEDRLYGGNGNDHLDGGGQNDELWGEDGDDELRGYDGDDSLYGGPGADTLVGEDGNDTLHGGAGPDTLAGELGSDIFSYSSGGVESSPGAPDTIEDFTKGVDKIAVFFVDANAQIAGNQAFTFVAPGGAAAAGTITYDPTGWVYAEIDGQPGWDFAVKLGPNLNLDASDFIL